MQQCMALLSIVHHAHPLPPAKQLKKHWKAINTLCSLSSVGFNGSTHTITATDSVWEDLLKVCAPRNSTEVVCSSFQTCKSFAQYCNFQFDLFDCMSGLCNRITAKGDHIVLTGAGTRTHTCPLTSTLASASTQSGANGAATSTTINCTSTPNGNDNDSDNDNADNATSPSQSVLGKVHDLTLPVSSAHFCHSSIKRLDTKLQNEQ
jgi:hypothetical protein